MTASMMEWEGAGLPEAPSAPETLQQAGLTIGFLNDLLLRSNQFERWQQSRV